MPHLKLLFFRVTMPQIKATSQANIPGNQSLPPKTLIDPDLRKKSIIKPIIKPFPPPANNNVYDTEY